MLLSKSQQQLFWSKWSAAVKAQGWRGDGISSGLATNAAAIEQERHLLLERAGFDSLRDVDPLTGFDRVLSELALLINPADLSAQVRLQNQPRDRLKTAIARVSPGNNYMKAVMRDKFGTEDWDSLSIEQLTQLRNTLAARKSSLRRKARNSEAVHHSPDSVDRGPVDKVHVVHPDNIPF